MNRRGKGAMLYFPYRPTKCRKWVRAVSVAGRHPPFAPNRLWGLWDMLRNYAPVYELAMAIQRRLGSAQLRDQAVLETGLKTQFEGLLARIREDCASFGFSHTADLAKRASGRSPNTHADIASTLTYLNDSLTHELEGESVLRIPSERSVYFESDAAFGPEVAEAFPSCARDIQRAGTCYAVGQEDACVHHLMLVLERGLNALAIKVEVPYQRTNWQVVIDGIRVKLQGLPRGPDRDFYLEITAQFGFLKDAYRNHSEHVRDDPYDLEKALSILNHVRAFMKQLASCCEEA
jgi:hypothetical protein